MKKEEKNSNKCPICRRPTHKESKYCIFHASAEEKTEEEFKKALKVYVSKIKKEDCDYDFKKFIFVGDIIFKEDLNVTTFKNADFSDAIFEGNADFSDAIFEDKADFGSATFNSGAVFRRVTFKGKASFWNVIFKHVTDFRRTTFKGEANFLNVIFESEVFFKKAIFENDVYFNRAILPSGKILSLRVKNKSTISFINTFLENIYLELDLGKEVFINFLNARLRNTRIDKELIKGHILQEQKKDFSGAKEIFLLVKNNFHSIGRYEDESWAYKKERDMERKSNYHFKTLHKWIWSCFLNGVYGYGEKPWNVIFSAGILILIFALLFSLIGIGNPEIIELKGSAIHQNSGNIVDLVSKGFIRNNTVRNFPDSLYFSLITFTTLGYGDFRPLEGIGRILAGSEAFIGAFMMALFVYTFARRTGGR